ncbi:nef protein [Simian immunodeficiency virus SIV-mnd 2]|uniref:Protein Nef n=1 Tax=Simian immunodeficiency virus SIV-mnd 2 TaxID=159122 RepID=Q8AII3_SIV|nr:nef protein [Simian immunodeficiency virus SIV-mnd 2]AAN85713.1 nef protein [Simian immunodeficiency virus SIV-mnd 2]
MGGKSSKQQEEKYLKYYKAMRRGYGAEGTNGDYQQLHASEPLLGALSTSQEEFDREQKSSSTDEEEETGFPVYPQCPVREPTYKDLVDMPHFLKEKGGLEGIWHSKRREEILDLYAQNEWGFIPTWQSYTDGPGIRYPKTFRFLFKLCPVAVPPDQENNECNKLLQSSQLGIQEESLGREASVEV